jgi:acyl-CoA thioesterase
LIKCRTRFAHFSSKAYPRPMDATPFTEARSWKSSSAGTWEGLYCGGWTQGRTLYGGMIVAPTLYALDGILPEGRSLRAMSATLCAPVLAGPAELRIEELRSGRSMSHHQARILQQGKVRAVIAMSSGAARPSAMALPGCPPPSARPPSELPGMAYLEEGFPPIFTRNFEYRWSSAGFPSPKPLPPHIQGWIRFRHKTRIDDAALVAMLDAWPPPSLLAHPGLYPLSTVSWQVSLLRPMPLGGASSDAWWFFESRNSAASEGYTDFHSTLWDEEGRVVAQSRQLVAEFSASA